MFGVVAQESDRWRQFCMQYAKSVAFKFAESWQQYSTNAGIGQGSVPVSDIVQQFTNKLSEELTERLTTPNVILPATTFLQTNISSNRTANDSVTYRDRSYDWRSLNEYERPASIADIAWLSRSRSEVASRGRSMLVDSMIQHQPASSNSSRSSTKRLSWFRSHFQTKTRVELIRESNVRYMSGSELETKQWRKCRLCLVKTAGGYLLEFYSPPKSSRAKSGIFCFLIMEVRETTPLEFEDGNESIFAIRGYNDAEYVIEARNPEDCQQWLAVIQSCVSENDPTTTRRFVRQPSAPPTGSGFLRNRQFFSTRSLNNVHSMTSMGIETRVPTRTIHGSIPGLEIYPWFHARLSRSVSARLVLHNGVDGHGLFLVRQSETRPGEFVLTFNCQGKAKHVRIVMMPDGECRIHQMIFETMIDLLEYFRDNPIPLESWRRRSLASLDLDFRDFLTYAGSVRLDIRALEELVRHEQHDRQHRTTTLNNSYRYQ
uniref:SH2 domain-containing protein n=1 Tax=Setaria digitata TaxID=48799 RepID=A0A915PC74_9BILA